MESDPAPVFLDTAYVNALINTRDQWHEAAVRWERKLAASRRRLITTEFFLVEIADGLAAIRFRTQAVRLITALQTSPLIEIIPASSHLFIDALKLYQSRTDKDWGLTDCASFVVMNNRALSEALTTDDHFSTGWLSRPTTRRYCSAMTPSLSKSLPLCFQTLVLTRVRSHPTASAEDPVEVLLEALFDPFFRPHRHNSTSCLRPVRFRDLAYPFPH
ncbi:MAG: type II toxin-antitoxin system VapC family toxin [Candidatus Tectomicrobia bacterium]|uniref:Type II toxin-antitoxin system VapC family toxin n=1 Tax=Tectimicrobiota bacterium TaxID=2528274 RepID=A0A932CQ09_UNCTE|nr:type II toxin-antitoxin system VapC family toxin [Candidatus Tectomicrobia bacterium]